jgi:hypothetical protein
MTLPHRQNKSVVVSLGFPADNHKGHKEHQENQTSEGFLRVSAVSFGSKSSGFSVPPYLRGEP